MMKSFWIWAACLSVSPLLSETIGDVAFQFPPSNYEWRLLFSSDSFGNLFAEEEDEDEDFELYPDTFEWGETENDVSLAKLFTHREGDALELFAAMQYVIDNDDIDENEEGLDTLERAQKEVDQLLHSVLPNHRIVFLNFQDGENEGLIEWALNDGLQNLMHGYSRFFTQTEADGQKMVTLLGYLTTAVRTEYNRSLWTQVLSQAQ